jgi:hypothetical protein
MKPHEYAVFREQALLIGRERAGIGQPPNGAPVWGAFMEIALPEGLVAIFALADGTASLYSSNGRAIIGGHSHERVRRAVWHFLARANAVQECVHRTEESPSPVVGRVAFYLRTDAGLRAAEFGEAELRRIGHPFLGLYLNGHAVLAELRRVYETLQSATGSSEHATPD